MAGHCRDFSLLVCRRKSIILLGCSLWYLGEKRRVCHALEEVIKQKFLGRLVLPFVFAAKGEVG